VVVPDGLDQQAVGGNVSHTAVIGVLTTKRHRS
jgi:hypothetical protein